MSKPNPFEPMVAATLALPPAQRDVVLPLVSAMMLNAADGPVNVPPAIEQAIMVFWRDLPKGDPEKLEVAVMARLKEVGVDLNAFFRSVTATNPPPDPRKALKALAQQLPRFEPRTAPAPGQVKAGPGARFVVDPKSPSNKKP